MDASASSVCITLSLTQAFAINNYFGGSNNTDYNYVVRMKIEPFLPI